MPAIDFHRSRREIPMLAGQFVVPLRRAQRKPGTAADIVSSDRDGSMTFDVPSGGTDNADFQLKTTGPLKAAPTKKGPSPADK